MPMFYVHRNAGQKVFVKGSKFFKDQGGLEKPWGKYWTPLKAESIEDARAKGEKELPLYTMEAGR